MSRPRHDDLLRTARALAAQADPAWGEPAPPVPIRLVDGVLLPLHGASPGGSLKGLVAAWWLDHNRHTGRLGPTQPVLTASSGNFAVGLAHACQRRAQPLTVVLSAATPAPYLAALRDLRAEVELVPRVSPDAAPLSGPDLHLAQQRARQLATERGAVWLDQLRDPACLAAHLALTGPALLRQLGEPPSAFVACVGSGASFLGIGAVLRAAWPHLRRVAVEPHTAAVLAGHQVTGPHALHGCGFGFRPPFWRADCADALHRVTDNDALAAQRHLAEHGVHTGPSGAAAFLVARRLRTADAPTLALLPEGSPITP